MCLQLVLYYSSYGQQTVTVNKSSTGTYASSWSTANPAGSNFMIFATCQEASGAPAYATYGSGPTSTTQTIYSREFQEIWWIKGLAFTPSLMIP
jgi:hypothetical protein